MVYERNLEIIREFLPQIVPGIFGILMGLPTSGKTTTSIKWLSEYLHKNNQARILFLAKYHDLIELEIIPKFLENGFTLDSIRHWKGKSTNCPKIQTKFLRGYNETYGSRYQCLICQRGMLESIEECSYFAQFQELPQIVVAPVQYVLTNRINPNDFDYIIVDDVHNMIMSLPPREEIEQWITELNEVDLVPETLTYTRLLDEIITNPSDIPPSLQFMHTISDAMHNFGDETRTRYDWSDHDIRSDLLEAPEKLSLILRYDLITLTRLAFARQKYGNKDYLFDSLLFKLFDLAQQTRVVLMDAFPEIPFFVDMKNLYKRHFSKDIELRTVELEYQQLPTAKVTRIIGSKHKRNFIASKTSITDRKFQSLDRIRLIITIIYDRHPEGEIAVITPKEGKAFSIDEWFSAEQLERIGNNRITFGKESGQNRFSECETLIVFHTYQTNIDTLIRMHNCFYDEQILSDHKGERSDIGTYYYPENSKLENLRRKLDDNTMLQAIFRSRGKCPVYVIGAVSERICNWMEYSEAFVKDGRYILNTELTIVEILPNLFYEIYGNDEVIPVPEVQLLQIVKGLAEEMNISESTARNRLNAYLANEDASLYKKVFRDHPTQRKKVIYLRKV